MIECSESANEEFLLELEAEILDKTGYSIQLKYKPVKTEWVPNINENGNDNLSDYDDLPSSNIFSCEFADNYDLEKQDKSILIEYLNKFICRIEIPMCYGYRRDCSDKFEITTKFEEMTRRIGDKIKIWLKSDKALIYRKCVFIVDDNDPELLRGNVYNLYIKPKRQEHPFTKIEEISPILYDYLYNVICDKNDELYFCILNYIAKIIQVGKVVCH